MQSCQQLVAEASPDLQSKMWKIHLWHPRKKAISKEVVFFQQKWDQFQKRQLLSEVGTNDFA